MTPEDIPITVDFARISDRIDWLHSKMLDVAKDAEAHGEAEQHVKDFDLYRCSLIQTSELLIDLTERVQQQQNGGETNPS